MEKKADSTVFPVLSAPSGRQRGISRREMVQRLLGSAGVGLVGSGPAAGHPIHRHLADANTLAQADLKAGAADWAPEFLDPHQNETVIVLSELIVPGSTKAQVNRFIDLLLSVDSLENQKRFEASLSAFEAESLNRFGRPFRSLAAAEQHQILTSASTAEPGQTGESEGSSWWLSGPPDRSSGTVRVTMRDHFENLKGWISGAYYSSEIGMRELGWSGDYYFDGFPGCQHPEGHH